MLGSLCYFLSLTASIYIFPPAKTPYLLLNALIIPSAFVNLNSTPLSLFSTSQKNNFIHLTEWYI